MYWRGPCTGGAPVLEGPLYWRGPCTGGAPVLEGPLYWRGPCTGGAPVLEGPLYWRGPCTGGAPVLEGPLYWRGPCTGGAPVLEGPLYWRGPCTGGALVLPPCYTCGVGSSLMLAARAVMEGAASLVRCSVCCCTCKLPQLEPWNHCTNTDQKNTFPDSSGGNLLVLPQLN